LKGFDIVTLSVGAATPMLEAAGGAGGHSIAGFLLTLAAILLAAKLFGELRAGVGLSLDLLLHDGRKLVRSVSE
jgi:hypothetical protein